MMHCVITQKHKPFSEDKFGINPVNVGIETWYNILTTGKYTETPITYKLMFEFLVRVPWMEEASQVSLASLRCSLSHRLLLVAIGFSHSTKFPIIIFPVTLVMIRKTASSPKSLRAT